MKFTARLTGLDAPAKLARRLERDLERARPPRLEGRFKDRGLTETGDPLSGGRGIETGDLRPAERQIPRAGRGRR